MRRSVDMLYFREDISIALFRDALPWWGDCAAPRERRTFMCTPIKTLLLVLVLLVGSTAYADARSRHGGYRGGGHGHRHYGPPPPALPPTLQVWARPPRLSPFLWGDILRRTPGMGCSRALHWRSPGSPRCTYVVLLHGPGGLLSHSVSVHGALDSGSAFRVAVRGLAGAPDVRVLARYVVWARHTFSGPASRSVASRHPLLIDLVSRVARRR